MSHIADTYHAWRGTESARIGGLEYENRAGFCYSATVEEIRADGHVLAPGRYVGAAEVDDGDEELIADKITRLTKELYARFDESARVEHDLRRYLEQLDV
jgi:type I restriction enzyme M protein